MMLDEAFAKQWLCSVGYYRLSAYWYPYREFIDEAHAIRGDNFIPGTKFEDIAALYEFDRKLRTLMHDGIERIEIGLRTQLNEYLGEIGGALAYQNPDNFRPNFKHAAWLDQAKGRVQRARSHNEAIRHHNKYYHGKLPIWVLSEVLDFSDVSRLFEGLPTKAQYRIAENLGVAIDDTKLSVNQRGKARKEHPLVRWFEQLTIVRNTSAHHSRLWNRSFAPVPTVALRTMLELQSLPQGQSERLYGALCMMNVLLAKISPSTTWPNKIRELAVESFSSIADRSVSEMGFPEGWQNDQIWNR